MTGGDQPVTDPAHTDERGPGAQATLGADDLASLAARAEVRHAAAGTLLLAAGQTVEEVLVVGTAEVQLRAKSVQGRHTMHVVRQGGIVADIPVLLGTPMPFDAVVTRAGTVWALDHDDLLAFLASAPSVAIRWMRSIAARLDADRRRLLALTATDLRGQVAHLLLGQAEPRPDGRPAVTLSHGVMAEMLGARRQSVSRVIAEFRAAGWITSGYREVVLLDLSALRQLAQPSLPW